MNASLHGIHVSKIRNNMKLLALQQSLCNVFSVTQLTIDMISEWMENSDPEVIKCVTTCDISLFSYNPAYVI